MTRAVNLRVGTLQNRALTALVNDTVGIPDQTGLTITPDNFVLGTTEPSAENTGLSDPTVSFTVVTAPATFNVDTPNITYNNYQFECWVVVRAPGVTFNNCKFFGPLNNPQGGGQPLVYAIHPNVAGAKLTINRCLFKPQTPNDRTAAFQGYNFTMIRCDVSWVVDTLNTYIPTTVGTDCNALVQGCFFHDNFYAAPTDSQSDNHTHNDGDQHQNGTNVTFDGTKFYGYWSTEVGVNQNLPGTFQTTSPFNVISGNVNDKAGKGLGRRNINSPLQMNRVGGGVVNDIHVLRSWVYGGVTSINLDGIPTGVTIYEVTNTRFEIPLLGKNYVIYCNTSATLVQCTGCTYIDDGTPMLGTVGNGRTNTH